MRMLMATISMLAMACGSTPPPAAATTGSQPAPHRRERHHGPTGAGSPYDAQTWIAKLDDAKERERAVTQLEQLGDPRAIKPLGELWLSERRSVRILQVLISLARPLTPEEAKQQFFVDYEQDGRKASWKEAVPYLERAVKEMDEDNPRSVDSAMKAAEALGEAKLALPALSALAQRPVTKKSIAAQIAAIRAHGQFAGNADAAKSLVKLISREPPPHPRTASSAAQGRELETAFGLALAIAGASMNALAELGTDTGATALVLAMYRMPELFTQARRALVAIGPAAKAELRKALLGKNTEVNALFRANKLGEYCGDHGDQPCQPMSTMTFYPAVVLGDFNDPAVAPDLVGVIAKPPLPHYYIDDQPSPSTQHNAAFHSLARLGVASTAPAIYKLWHSPKTELMTRTLAVAAYPFVARDTSGVKELGDIAADNLADDTLRTEAATAFARLSTSKQDIKLLTQLAQKYFEASAKKEKEAAKATDKKAKKHADQAAKAYTGYAHMFLAHVARIEIGVRCKSDARCYAETLALTPATAVKTLEPYISDIDQWTDEEKRGLVSATIDRAMLDLGKLGTSASKYTDALLDAANTDDRLTREAILRALPKIATLPCPTCVTKLDAAIRAGEGNTALGDVNIETAVLRNYFRWAAP